MAKLSEVIYQKYRNGDALTDTELRIGHDFFTQLEADLSQVGATFELARREASRVADGLANYIQARRSMR